jgi:hypothetical protein
MNARIDRLLVLAVLGCGLVGCGSNGSAHDPSHVELARKVGPQLPK